MTKKEEIRFLIEKLNEASDAYYNKNNPIMKDFEFDIIMDELRELEAETGIIYSDSPTQRVGYEVKSNLEKVAHEHPMLSLDKTKSFEDVKKFVGNKPALIMFKLDGLTIAVTYEDGKLVRAETRGNGVIGEDVTHNARVFANLPLTIPTKEKVVVFGEAIIDYPTFHRINAQLPADKKYKNPRNLASGTIRQLDSKICAERGVRFVAWRGVEGFDSPGFARRLEIMQELGFEIVNWVWFDAKRPGLFDAAKKAAEEKGIPIDGCVISFDDCRLIEQLGATSHHLRGQLAFKYDEDREYTTLRDIEWSMGKTGVLSPVAVFDPVELAGTTVERASLHNLKIMDELMIRIGATVTVVKKNEIIPQIIACESNGVGAYQIPQHCPVCGSDTMIDGDFVKCGNSHCRGKLLGELKHFVSRDAMNVDGLSEATLEFLIKMKWVTWYGELYNLENKKDIWAKYDGFGKKSVEKILNALNKSRETTLARVINAMSIPGVGKSVAADIAKFCEDDFDRFVYVGMSKTEKFKDIDGVGDIMVEDIGKWFADALNVARLQTFKQCLKLSIPEAVKVEDERLVGQTFVITGSLNHFKNRAELESVIKSNGGSVAGSVSKNTSYLINNDKESASSKNKKAQQLGVQIISEEDFMAMVRG